MPWENKIKFSFVQSSCAFSSFRSVEMLWTSESWEHRFHFCLLPRPHTYGHVSRCPKRNEWFCTLLTLLFWNVSSRRRRDFFFFISFRLLWWHQQSMSRHRGVIHTSHMNMILFVISFRLTKCVQCFFFLYFGHRFNSKSSRLSKSADLCGSKSMFLCATHTHTYARTYADLFTNNEWNKLT